MLGCVSFAEKKSFFKFSKKKLCTLLLLFENPCYRVITTFSESIDDHNFDDHKKDFFRKVLEVF